MAVKDTAPYQKQNHPHQTWNANPSIGQVSGPCTDPDSCAALPAAAAPAEVTGSGSRGRTLNAACIQTASPSAAAPRLLSLHSHRRPVQRFRRRPWRSRRRVARARRCSPAAAHHTCSPPRRRKSEGENRAVAKRRICRVYVCR